MPSPNGQTVTPFPARPALPEPPPAAQLQWLAQERDRLLGEHWKLRQAVAGLEAQIEHVRQQMDTLVAVANAVHVQAGE